VVNKWKIGKATLEVLQNGVAYEGQPMGSMENSVGRMTTYKATTSDFSTVIFGVVTWPSALTEVVPVDVLEGSQEKYERLKRAGRMSVDNHGQKWVAEMKVMKFNNEQGKANLAGATHSELTTFAESEIKGVLSAFGDAEIGTKEELIGETNRNRTKLALRCDSGNTDLIAAAYVVTRVLAILKDFGM
jgi:hypothetical protein